MFVCLGGGAFDGVSYAKDGRVVRIPEAALLSHSMETLISRVGFITLGTGGRVG